MTRKAKMRRSPMRLVLVEWKPKAHRDPWLVRGKGLITGRLRTRREAVAWAIAFVREEASLQRPITLKVKNRGNGRFSKGIGERTYPRGADPRRSRG